MQYVLHPILGNHLQVPKVPKWTILAQPLVFVLVEALLYVSSSDASGAVEAVLRGSEASRELLCL